MLRTSIGILVMVLASLPARGFDWGVTINGSFDPEKVLARVLEAGLQVVRLEVTWRDERRFLEDDGHPVRRLARGLRAQGVDVILIVGNGFAGALPEGANPDPDPDGYIRDMASHVGRVAGFASTLGIRRFQIENELNAAGSATLPPFEWRKGRSWWSFDFKKKLAHALSAAVRGSVPGARVWMNIHDAVSDIPHRAADYVEAWSGAIDGVGLDFYPNYLFPRPVLGDRIRRRIASLRETSGLPVLVMETGYPSKGYGHSVELQERYVDAVGRAAYEAGALGLVYFRLQDAEPPPGDGLDPDLAIEPYFGLLDPHYEPKRAGNRVPWETLKALVRTCPARRREF